MTGGRSRHARAIAIRVTIALAIGGLLLAILFAPFAGRFLVREDPLQKSDAILVLAGDRVQRWLEAVDLYQAGWAPRIVLSPGRTEDAERLLQQRGVRFPSGPELIRKAMIELNVPAAAVSIAPGSVDSTAQEAYTFARIASAGHWQRVIVVTSKYHTRRARFAFVRAFGSHGIDVVMRATRYDTSEPRRWWSRRADARWVLSELQKQLAYWLGLGS